MKFKKVKEKARKRNQLIKKQQQTGGGQLTKQEKRIVESEAYSDLVAKLGASASGNDARNDSDSQNTVAQIPTARLASVFADENALDSFPGLLFKSVHSFKTFYQSHLNDISEALETQLTDDHDSMQNEATNEAASTSQTNSSLNRRLRFASLDECSFASTLASASASVSESVSTSTPNTSKEISGSKRSKRLTSQTTDRSKRAKDDGRDIEEHDLLTSNLLMQQTINELQKDVLELQKQKLENEVQKGAVELERAKFDLETAKQLSIIEIDKQKQLAALEIEMKRKQLERGD